MTSPTFALFLGGRSGVGKSTVALALHDLLVERDIQHALIEGDNLDLAHPEPWRTHPDAQLAEANLGAMWANYRALGYRRLIYTNTVSVLQLPQLSAALGGDVDATGVLLRAGTGSVEVRLGMREQGDSLSRHLERSAAAALRLDAEAPVDVHRIDTDGLTAREIATRLLDLIGWDRR
ncbi:adenylyl-sulfate kinase [Mycetocola zhujimingii]|uniref:ATPase n=1 Tax=Mycetocola zhujimingii TaxID=2079792 RepID=A0A2U1TCE7_9MICO|nr:adenylyl-sulfate kinase [Mycetocola zhujimingii]PWC06453.1 ATPase [Mycetocola zhujimingii]